MFWNMNLSIWHKWWCKFGVAIVDIYGDIRGGLLHGQVWCWWWHLAVLVLFCTDLRRLLVRCRHSRRCNLVSPSGQESCLLCCGGLVEGLLVLQKLCFSGRFLVISWWRIWILSRNYFLPISVWIRDRGNIFIQCPAWITLYISHFLSIIKYDVDFT